MVNFPLLILCAGFGNRMQELTINTPKALLKVKNKILLDNTINFFRGIGCGDIYINTHYKYNKILSHINKNYGQDRINIIYEPKILGTGGGIKNIFNYTESKKICVVNCDIFWHHRNKNEIIKFVQDFNNTTNCKILLSTEANFFGLKADKGDFNLTNGNISNWYKGDKIKFFTVLQIVSKNIFHNSNRIFSMNEIWNNLILNKTLTGSIIQSKILHIGDKNSYLSI